MIFIRLDENISHKIGVAAETIGIPTDWVIDCPERGERGLKEPAWMERHAHRGDPGSIRIAFSADNFTIAERVLAQELDITLFATPRMYWRPLRRMGQAA